LNNSIAFCRPVTVYRRETLQQNTLCGEKDEYGSPEKMQDLNIIIIIIIIISLIRTNAA